MTSVIFSLLAATLIFISAFVGFSSNTFAIFRKDFDRQARDRTADACMAHGDLLVRSRSLGSGKDMKKEAIYTPPCLFLNTNGCALAVTCKIRVDHAQNITVDIQ